MDERINQETNQRPEPMTEEPLMNTKQHLPPTRLQREMETRIAHPTALNGSKLNIADSLISALSKSSLQRKSEQKVREEFMSHATDLIVFQMSQDAVAAKSQILIDSQERQGVQDARVAELVRQAVEASTDQLFNFNFAMGRREVERLNELDQMLAQGAITERRYNKEIETVERMVDTNIERMRTVFDQWVEQTLSNFKALATRQSL